MRKAFLAGLCLLAVLPLAAYEAIIFGDVHYDSDEVRDPAVKRPAYQEREKQRNLANWKENIPALISRGAKKVGKETAFAVQLGDICQGDCGSQKLHEKSMNSVVAIFKKSFPETRFLWLPGNHDIRGTGAKTACRTVMIPYLSKTLNQQLPSKGPIQYAFMQEKDLFVALDGNEPDVKFLEKTLAQHPERRHLFIMTHLPVIPISSSVPMWVIGGRPAKPEVRKALYPLLAKNNAIVLCGHIHHTTLTRWQNEAGTITQVSLFSIFPDKPAEAKMTNRDLKKLFPKLMDAKESKNKTKQLANLQEYIPYYKELKEIQPNAGFAILKPDDKGVTLELYHTTKDVPTYTLKLK